MYSTIALTNDKRINISETVYETAKSMRGNFSIEDIKFQINIQLGDDEQLTRKQIASSLNNLSKQGTKLQKLNSNWYTWD